MLETAEKPIRSPLFSREIRSNDLRVGVCFPITVDSR
jgi:hypothetical protein